MWTDRYTTYYSKDRQWAVRWVPKGRPEPEAQVKKFKDKRLAEQFYNEMVAAPGSAKYRIELFFSQAKWVQYYGNYNEFGELQTDPIGESSLCLSGDHEQCADGAAASCTCPCHHVALVTKL